MTPPEGLDTNSVALALEELEGAGGQNGVGRVAGRQVLLYLAHQGPGPYPSGEQLLNDFATNVAHGSRDEEHVRSYSSLLSGDRNF